MEDAILINVIKEHKGLICSIINKYTKYYEFDDLYQVSIIGIMKALRNYKDDKNVKLTTYIYKYILGEVLAFIKDSNLIKSSREYHRLYKKILEAKTILTQKLMKEPSLFEISQFLEIEENILEDVIRCQERVKSLDEVILDDGKKLTLLDQVSLECNNINLDNLSLQEGLQSLSKEEYELINLRYFEERTQSEIAQIWGTNQVQISRNEKKILKKLKNNLCKT